MMPYGCERRTAIVGKMDSGARLVNKAMRMKPEGQISRTVGDITLHSVEIQINDTESSYEAI